MSLGMNLAGPCAPGAGPQRLPTQATHCRASGVVMASGFDPHAHIHALHPCRFFTELGTPYPLTIELYGSGNAGKLAGGTK